MSGAMEYAMDRHLTVPAGNRPTGMRRAKQRSWKRLAAIAVLLCAAASARVVANPAVRRPVVQFMNFYEQTPELGVWERVVYSVLMTKEATEPSS